MPLINWILKHIGIVYFAKQDDEVVKLPAEKEVKDLPGYKEYLKDKGIVIDRQIKGLKKTAVKKIVLVNQGVYLRPAQISLLHRALSLVERIMLHLSDRVVFESPGVVEFYQLGRYKNKICFGDHRYSCSGMPETEKIPARMVFCGGRGDRRRRSALPAEAARAAGAGKALLPGRTHAATGVLCRRGRAPAAGVRSPRAPATMR